MSIRGETWELEGRTLGIVGLGGTGIDVAKRAQGFDMRVIAVDPEDVDPPPFVHEVWKMDRFYDLLEESDVVSICAPLTQETHGMFNDTAFQRMKPHALLINVTRGKIVDGPSLLRALNEGQIGGAGLDVTPEEPLPLDSPLWDMLGLSLRLMRRVAHRFGLTERLGCSVITLKGLWRINPY